MKVSSLLAFCPLFLAVFAAPLAAISSQAGQRDRSNIYLMTAAQLKSAGASYPDIREVGPQQPFLSRLVYVSPRAHERLVAENYWVIPAGLFAEICGISSTRTTLIERYQ